MTQSTTQNILNGVVQNMQLDVISAKNEGLRILQSQVADLSATVARLQDDLRQRDVRIEELEDDGSQGEHATRLKLASWMLSQKAFKELAIEYGRLLGKSSAQVRAEGDKLKAGVLARQHNPLHVTNATPFINEYAQALAMELQAPSKVGADFQADVDSGKLYRVDAFNFAHWFEAVEHWKTLADAGNREAQFNIAACFMVGRGTDVDFDQADRYYQQASGNGEPKSNYELATLYRNQHFPRADPAVAECYFAAAVAQNEPRALADQLSAQQAAARQLAEAEAKDQARQQQATRLQAILSLYEPIRTFQAGASVPHAAIEQLAELHAPLAQRVAWCYGAVLEASTANRTNLGTFWKPEWVADLEVRLYLSQTAATFDCRVACFADEMGKQGTGLAVNRLRSGTALQMRRPKCPSGSVVEKVEIVFEGIESAQKIPPMVISLPHATMV